VKSEIDFYVDTPEGQWCRQTFLDYLKFTNLTVDCIPRRWKDRLRKLS